MRHNICGLTFAVWVALATPAIAGEAVDFSSDRFLVGQWSCTSERAGGVMGREDASYAIGLQGRWLQLSYSYEPTSPRGPTLHTEAHETFDPTIGKWVYISVSSDGSYGISYSDGWKGDTKIYGPKDRQSKTFQLIATRVSDEAFTEEVQTPDTNGAWVRSSILRCSKLK